ncbi:hypothetical protein F1737_07510 [Methanoplanus sp. FWC-SCC4]|uniref:Uncharacterized protein n=1 Tax=Methanochimaera problematica TaxID=2609417 RepID=A0AA97FE10_9EURY|nr:hypothetical protein [Methanoplanus sp. FWC-SCC4]WOF16548.1 hypothetical protein F1737_07510 [Methanoplanus sp. FWC-SCC4]
MDEYDNMKDIVLAVILVISTLVMVVRLWQDWIVAVSTGLMMISLAGLILSLCNKINTLEETLQARERTMRVNLEEITGKVDQKCDKMVDEVGEMVTALSRRVYR